MIPRVAVLRERLRESLFVEPVLFMAAGIVVGEAALAVDERLNADDIELPFLLSSTVDGARALVTTVATATLTVAGIAFSVALLVFQMASSQFSPRIIDSIFRDAFNKRVIGLVVGTFAYCLMVLRAVRGPLFDGGEAVVPALSVSGAVLLGLGSLLAIVAFINHSAHSMKISELLRRIADEAIDRAGREGEVLGAGLERLAEAPRPDGQGFVVHATSFGWLQHIDAPQMLGVLDDGAVVRIETAPGTFVVHGSPLCTVWPVPEEHRATEAAAVMRDAITLGRTRTFQQDPTYGLRQLADVAIIALSPGVNDPTTAESAIFHIAAVLVRSVTGPEVGPRRDGCGRVLVPATSPSHEELVRRAFDEIRRDSVTRPAVCVYILDALGLVARVCGAGTSPAVHAELARQARLVVDGCVRAGGLPEDVDLVLRRYDAHFGAASTRPARSSADGA